MENKVLCYVVQSRNREKYNIKLMALEDVTGEFNCAGSVEG